MKYIRNNNIKNIFLVARWSHYVMEGDKKVPTAFLSISGQRATSTAARAEAFEKYLLPMVSALVSEGRNIYIIKQAPEQFNYDPRTLFYHSVRSSIFQVVGTKTMENVSYQSQTNAVIDSLKGQEKVQLIDPATVLCKDGTCDLLRDGNLLYRDENHLSIPGVMMLEPLLNRTFKDMHP